jgi:hypothetical protein
VLTLGVPFSTIRHEHLERFQCLFREISVLKRLDARVYWLTAFLELCTKQNEWIGNGREKGCLRELKRSYLVVRVDIRAAFKKRARNVTFVFHTCGMERRFSILFAE